MTTTMAGRASRSSVSSTRILWRADLRHALRGRRRYQYGLTALLGLVGALVMSAVAGNASIAELLRVDQTTVVSLAALTSTVTIALITAATVTREASDGSLLLGKTLAPRHSQFMVSRLLTTATLAVAATLAAAGLAWIVAIVVPAVGPRHLGEVAATVLVCCVGAATAAVGVLLTGLCVRRGFVLILLLLAVLVGAPLLLTALTLYAGFPQWIVNVLPGQLWSWSVALPLGDQGNWTQFWSGHLGVLLWLAVLGMFARRAVNSDRFALADR